jgi:glycosyltransferase involved in cell wall biosynthesis
MLVPASDAILTPMSDPGISVIVPNYNHGQFLPRSLSALANQSVPPTEIIVVDDASTDNSLAVLGALAEQHPRLRVCANERNLGVQRTMNRGLELAHGEYVFFSAADDEVRPGLFDQSLRLLRAHPEAGLCSGLVEWRCAATGLVWLMGTRMPRRAGYLSPDEMIALGRRGRLMISGPCAVFRKSALVAAGGWLPELRWFCDFFGAYVVGFRHGMCHVPHVLANFNLSPTSYYHTARSRGERREVLDRMLQLLESPAYADVAPALRASGLLGTFGWPMLRAVMARRRHWGFLTLALTRRAARRGAEVIGRRCFPKWLARWSLRVCYNRTP